MVQEHIFPNGRYTDFVEWIKRNQCKKTMIVCDRSMLTDFHFNLYVDEIQRQRIQHIGFHDYSPNPTYESVAKGVKLFRESECDSVIAVGGGSSIDVGKCIKLYSNIAGDGENGSFLKQENIQNDIPFLAVPTTAGSGSEATRYAVIYYRGKKQSITNDSCVPGTVLFDISFLKTLPEYQRKSTMCDALCHAIESLWSINSTQESKEYSKEAIHGVLEYMDSYLNNTDKGNAGMIRAAHKAGMAISISQTTAGHAMCYSLTGLFGCAHGHSVILCNRILYPWMLDNMDKCIDPRGQTYVKDTLDEIGKIMGCRNAKEGTDKLERIFTCLKLEVPVATFDQFKELRCSVNPVRLKNHPFLLDENTIDELYHNILREKER